MKKILLLVLSTYLLLFKPVFATQKNTIDIVQNKIDLMMQDTASWLDSFASSKKINDKASANGYLQLGWLPKTADLADVETKFKVRMKLPNWNDKIAFVIDNDDEDDLKLDYEADTIEKDKDDLNLAVQYIKDLNENLKVKNRIGISRSQIYVRSELKRKWDVDTYQFQLTPRLDFFNSDGWAPSVIGTIFYPFESSSLSLSVSWQKIQSEKYARKKIGFYHIKSLTDEQLLVSGLQYSYKKDSNESYLASVRYRNTFCKKWMYIEFEPFLEFNQINRYKTEVGIALRLIGYYGK
ncbi:hypothetical protein CJF42_12795 [Pseudoalteromonas sp. NBT06-2]|uniref:hypothetical protein n=1 Tax=Pseudoalteromonas sp. NBT06-2 TaxID=2025950 RepID=UPI000BA60A6C|nr:hypothetical protein [Pseudoalteromonas sp. NBT06-2]PAJ74021.1 hypothetical protein CJF42_12795 [Pseudoalteromonas sp. NBT06-2]